MRLHGNRYICPTFPGNWSVPMFGCGSYPFLPERNRFFPDTVSVLRHYTVSIVQAWNRAVPHSVGYVLWNSGYLEFRDEGQHLWHGASAPHSSGCHCCTEVGKIQEP